MNKYSKTSLIWLIGIIISIPVAILNGDLKEVLLLISNLVAVLLLISYEVKYGTP